MLKLIKDAPSNDVSHEKANGAYSRHLTTKMKDWKDEMSLPAKLAISKAMLSFDKKTEQQDKAENLISETVAKGHQALWWSDQHFFHNNIIHYANRPFHDVENMHQEMVDRYNNHVKDEDVVVFGGDFSFGVVENSRKILQSLRGKKILVLGNHDFDKKGMTLRDYHHFDAICMQLVLWRSADNNINDKKENGHYLLATHYPIRNDFLPPNTINIHGHIHQHSAGIRHVNMSVEHTEYQPKNIDQLLPMHEAAQRLANNPIDGHGKNYNDNHNNHSNNHGKNHGNNHSNNHEPPFRQK